MSEVTFRHSVAYPNATHPTLTDIANTLIAHEKLVFLLAELLENSLDGVTVNRINIELERAEAGSIYEHFLVALFVVFQKDLEKDVPDVIEALTGYRVDERFDTIITVLLFVLLFWGARYLGSRVLRKTDPNAPVTVPPAIQGDYNTYIHIAADQLNIPPERLEHAVEKVAQGNKRQTLGRAAADLFRPAKRGGDGRIVAKGIPEVSPAAIAEFPNEAALADLGRDTEIEPYPNVVLEIRATDRDKRAQGWAGILEVEGLERRVPITLFPTIDMATLAQCRRARVDTMVETKAIGDDERVPVRIHVITVHECLDAQTEVS
jgi:hypothetical protein